MRNLLIIGLLAFVFVAPLGVRAQTATPVTNEQLLEMIQSLMQQVLSLMEQLKKIEATQVVAPVVIQPTITTPVLGSQTTNVTLGTPFCSKSSEGWATIPVSVSGINWNYALADLSDASMIRRRSIFPNKMSFDDNQIGTTSVNIKFTNSHQSSPWATNENQFDSPTYETNLTVVLPNCQ